MKKGKIEILKEWITEHKYCYAMLYLVFYLVAFFALDFTMEPKYILHCTLDDRIPFCEFFIVFYFAWYPAFFLSLVWYMLRDKEDFQQLWFIMFNGITFCLICYVLFPNGLNLREEVPNRNIFCVLVNLVRGVPVKREAFLHDWHDLPPNGVRALIVQWTVLRASGTRLAPTEVERRRLAPTEAERRAFPVWTHRSTYVRRSMCPRPFPLRW